MRISQITDHFVQRNTRSGCYTRSIWDSENQTQQLIHRHSRNPIAEIYDYKDANNYRLRLHPNKERYGRNGHNNRLYAVLTSVQKSNGRSWDYVRYSTHIRYSLKVWDRKLNTEYDLGDSPMEFIFRDGRLTLDYAHFEKRAFPQETTTPVVELNDNANLRSVSTRLTNILQGV